MITSFGKFLRNLRMDKGELLLDMATKLKVSSAFLSGVENGKRKIPESWLEKIAALYNFSAEQKDNMKASYFDSNNKVDIELHSLQDDQRNLAIAFARKLESIPESDIEKILKILERKRK